MTSIIILTSNQLELTKKCIRSIRKHTPVDHEIIFVDNGSTDGTVKWLQGLLPENKNYQLIANQENVGFARGRNQGIILSRGDVIVLLDNDTVVSEGWLAGMLSCLNHAPAAGVIGPMTNNCNGMQQIEDGSYQSVNFLDKYADKFREENRNRRIPYRNIAGFCMLFKKLLIDKIGLLDESLGPGRLEDEDFCWRSALDDRQNYICGDVFIHRNGGQEPPDNRSVIDRKWTLCASSVEGKKLAVLKATEIADNYYSKGKIDEGIEALINCIKLTPEAKRIYYELTRFFCEIKKFPEAWEVVATMPEAAKNELKGLEWAGYAKEGLGLDAEAAVFADKILSLNEIYPPALNLKGVLAYKTNKKDEAQSYFKRAIDADPGYGEAYTNLGVLYWGVGQKDKAFANFKKGFNLSPTLPDINSIYYSAVTSLGMLSDAEAEFFECCRLYPYNRNLAFLYIDILIRQNKLAEAMRKIEEAIVFFGPDEGTLNAALAVRDKIGPLRIEKGSNKRSLSLCMIVKNEEKYLASCLKSLRDVVDEMIIVDTGSTDKTKNIARVFGAKVFDFSWTGDFAVARNHSLDPAEGDWILIMDADEVISPLDHEELRNLVQKDYPSPAAYSIITRNYTNNVSIIGWTPNDGKYPEETRTGWMISGKVRLFPRRKDVFFVNPVHELVENTLEKAKIPVFNCNIIVHHYGKLDAEKDSQKGEEYYLLGKMKYESDPTNAKYINELAKQALVLNKIEEAVELWLKLLSLIENKPQSPGYREIALSSHGDPIAEIYSQLATAYLGLDRFDEALSSARKSMKAEVRLHAYLHIYAQCEIIAGSLEKAYAALLEILETTPDYPPALFLEAIIFCLQGEKDKVRKLFQFFREKRIEITTLLHTIARRVHSSGNNAGALVILNAAIDNNISNTETEKLLEEYANQHHKQIK